LTKVSVAVEGWNAEAAIGFALAARRFASAVALGTSRETVDGKDDVDVMTLGPAPGEEVLMAVDGEDEDEAFSALLAKLLGVIEPTKDRLAALTRPDSVRRARTKRSPHRRVADIVSLGSALEVEEVAPVRHCFGNTGTGQIRPAKSRRGSKRVCRSVGRDSNRVRHDKLSARHRKKGGHPRQAPKTVRRVTPARRRPRKRK
jgi:phosphotransferase system HPr (HPr) family protein